MGRRQVIDIAGMGHRAPISLGVRIDNVVYTSGISGRDTEKGEMPEDAAGQAKCMFQNIRQVMEAAGGSTDDIIYMQLRLKDRALREFVDPEWLAMFPDPEDRPARNAEAAELGGGMLMQCQIMAVLPQ
ncbi:MAG: RidA family protein [Chloroflexota bacterium]|nr:RidA family protein [Chloroflexota bacterium]MDE2885377.1 RidA family protein [Chloroflexota bacterium]